MKARKKKNVFLYTLDGLYCSIEKNIDRSTGGERKWDSSMSLQILI